MAEIMLQQTQVSTVWPYYKRWLKIYPNVQTLASAKLDQILKMWEGLGYYARARNLHKGANYVCTELKGCIPQTASGLQKIPGIGPYTAAAISSIVFNENVPVIDGNVLRVMARINRIEAPPQRPVARRTIQEALQHLMLKEKPGIFNQALMDLGRVICTPSNPDCGKCPVQQVCLAHEQGQQTMYPIKVKKKALPHYNIVIGIVRKGERILIQKRPPEGLLGGLWEFPGGKIEKSESEEEALLREIKEETGLEVEIEKPVAQINHAYTHFKIHMSAWICRWVSGEALTHAATENRWVALEELNTFAFPGANRKIIHHLQAGQLENLN